MQKIVTRTLRCGTTGEFYTVSTLVTVINKDQEQIEKRRAAAEAKADQEAEAEAMALRRHRAMRPGTQKIGWRPAGV
jgi:hypothetical protein